METIWKDIIGFEGLYQVSNTGEVRSMDRVVSMNQGNRKKFISGCVMKSCANTKGYLHVSLSKDGRKTSFDIHRLVCLIFKENPLNLPEVNHIDANKKNNFISNLEWIDRTGNVAHAVVNNLIKFKKCRKGENNSQSRLKNSVIPEIRSMRESGNTLQFISKKYGVSISAISGIIKKRSYTHV